MTDGFPLGAMSQSQGYGPPSCFEARRSAADPGEGGGSPVLSWERPPSQAEEQRGTPPRRPGGAAQEHLFESVVSNRSL